jgi:hypothetical protein
MRAIRLLFVYCLAHGIFGIYRAYEIYQGLDNWFILSRKEKFLLAWGVVSTIIMAIFTVAYITLEYRMRQMGRKDKM